GCACRKACRTLEGLRLARSLWSGKPVEWDGRWKVEHGILGPAPYRQDGPPIWIGGSLPASLDRAGRFFDGWVPIASDADQWARLWNEVKEIARTTVCTGWYLPSCAALRRRPRTAFGNRGGAAE